MINYIFFNLYWWRTFALHCKKFLRIYHKIDWDLPTNYGKHDAICCKRCFICWFTMNCLVSIQSNTMNIITILQVSNFNVFLHCYFVQCGMSVSQIFWRTYKFFFVQLFYESLTYAYQEGVFDLLCKDNKNKETVVRQCERVHVFLDHKSVWNLYCRNYKHKMRRFPMIQHHILAAAKETEKLVSISLLIYFFDNYYHYMM